MLQHKNYLNSQNFRSAFISANTIFVTQILAYPSNFGVCATFDYRPDMIGKIFNLIMRDNKELIN